MKKIFTYLAAALTMIMATGCFSSTEALLPNISGKAGEVIIAMDRENWEGDLGVAVRDLLGGDCPYLVQKEPLFSLVNVSPTGFSDLFKVHRNIVFFDVNSNVQNPGVSYKSDIWARPQCFIQISANDPESMLKLFNENSQNIANAIEQAERDRIISNAKHYPEVGVADAVREMVGGSPSFPSGYKLKKKTEDFIWIADDKQYSIQGIFIYKYPAAENDNFSEEAIVSHRNRFLEANVPGMFENTWMTTSTFITPSVEFMKFRSRQFAQARGFWEVQNDFMGGPFVSHSFYSPDGKEIVVVEGWVYAPKYDKRQYLRQVEAIVYSFEWDEKNKSAE